MQEYIEKRVLEICDYIIQTGATVRQAAAQFGVSKSTVHKDLTERLPELNKEQYERVKVVLDNNKAERHLRGGEATRQKYAYQAQLWAKNKKKQNFDGNMTCIRNKNILK
ncbi:MAG: sporulation transcriptional regulator SpoIIID [Peptococcaceae bacterium]|mgnify:CR=1 FL=1|nr:sporulation transcriptional regulator SpoIIID [Peptococcaceae bacterium]